MNVYVSVRKKYLEGVVFLLISLSISVSKGPLPRKESDTKVSFGLHESTVDTEWSASATHDPSGNTLSVSISSSPNAPIGRYSLTLDQEGQTTSLGEFILLFNAWCPSEYRQLIFFPPTSINMLYSCLTELHRLLVFGFFLMVIVFNHLHK